MAYLVFICLFIVSRCTRDNIYTYIVKAQHLRLGSREGRLSCHDCCDTGLGFCGLIISVKPSVNEMNSIFFK